MKRIVVVGGGVSGLGAALALARRGHEVIVVERDATPMPPSADEAFAWDRHGAPQVRHSHAFLARLVNLLRSDYPDVFEALVAEGATELRFGTDLPPTMVGYEPEPADAELSMLACRRTTFEWVLRRAAMSEGRVRFVTGVGVDGLLAYPGPPDPIDSADAATANSLPASGPTEASAEDPAGAVGTLASPDGTLMADGPGRPLPPRVSGVRLSDGSSIEADLVVAAGGRRAAITGWLAELGAVTVPEEVEDTGIVYFSRFYRLREGADYPARVGGIGGDLGYLKYGVFIGDKRTFSITLATAAQDGELRKLLADPVVFDRCAGELVATAPYLDGRATPLSDEVHTMAGLLNRWRDYVVDGVPVATGLLPVGDAVLCTNPLYGRGCSTGFWGAHLLAAAVDEHPDDDLALALAYDDALRANLLPWYRSTAAQDAEARRVAAALLAGEDPDADSTDSRTFMRSVLRDGLFPALREDPVVLRAFFRVLNLVSQPDALMTDQAVFNRVLAIWQDRDNRPPLPVLGPKHRTDLLALLTS